MSTSSIKSVIARLEEALGPDMLPGQRAAIDGARAEVAAIERAARAFHEDMSPLALSHAPKSIHEAMDLLTDIAKEAHDAPPNWATFANNRNPSAPRADEKPAKPEVLPEVSPEALAERAKRETHLRDILDACDD